ncbi:MAG TPA: PrsW family intramembrane metalloprotease [Blastocatellia bacterium]|nr:PrsW family intramembrane metalloprotease [Blastocatellia bacterium]HAF22041.1 PrsW family intramembrane metalloprotease [Blastocatellia bacterium]HCX29281.1 PrsW family intramembrane metalloprotease [Blastocatellia bacterium]
MPNAANQPASIALKPSTSKSAIKIILGIVAILVALLLGLLVLLLIGFETGPIALLVGLVSATLPVPLYLVLVLWIDRYEAEPLWMLATAFFWGALVAVFFAFLINTASGVAVTLLTQDVRAGEAFGAVISAPIVEESAKALILFIFFFWKKDEFDGVIDGIVYAAMVGLGFAMTENIQYYGRAVTEAGGGGLTLVFILRGALSPFSHPMFTSLTGIGLGLARQSRNLFVKFVTPVFGLLAAICMHSIWNGSVVIFGGGGFLLMYILIMIPAFFIMFVVIALALRREGQIVREFLIPDFQGGLLTQQEYNQLGSIRGRMGASFNALSRGGLSNWQARRQLNQLASELAFHRSRVARGITAADASEREAAYRQALADLLRRLRVN